MEGIGQKAHNGMENADRLFEEMVCYCTAVGRGSNK